jgi:hypothetical protein
MQALYVSEINVSVTSFWDDGWTVKLGDEMNGFKAQEHCANDGLSDAALWPIEQAKKHYPDSDFVAHLVRSSAIRQQAGFCRSVTILPGIAFTASSNAARATR